MSPCIWRSVNQCDGNTRLQQRDELCWWNYYFAHIWIMGCAFACVLVDMLSFCGIWTIVNSVQSSGKLMKIFFTFQSPSRPGSMTLYFIISVISFIFQGARKEQQCFQGLWFLLKGSHLAKWQREQGIYPLRESHPDYVSNRWLQDTPLSVASQPALVTEGRTERRGGVEKIITSINEALRTIRTAGSPDLVSKATSARSFVL